MHSTARVQVQVRRRQQCPEDAVGRAALLSLIKPGEGKAICPFSPRQVLFAQGDFADSLYYLLSGQVKLTAVSPQGREAVAAILKPGDFFGENCLVGQSSRLMTAVALTAGASLRLERESTREMIATQPALANFLLTRVLTRTARIEEDLLDQLFNKSERRLARLLLLLANFPPGQDSAPLVPKINQETLAEMIGTTRPRVCFFMNKFRRLGYIHYGTELTVHRSLRDVVASNSSCATIG